MASRNLLWSILLPLALLWGCSRPLVSQDYPATSDIRPYVGLIRNLTTMEVVIPSANSNAALVVPPGATMEYCVWEPAFTLSVYAHGRQIYCRHLRVAPQKYAAFCRRYDFLADIPPEAVGRGDSPLPQLFPAPGAKRPLRPAGDQAQWKSG